MAPLTPPAGRHPHHDPTVTRSGDDPNRPTARVPRRTAMALGITGAAIAGGLMWGYRPGGPFTREAQRKRVLRNDPMGAETILGHEAVDTAESSPRGLLSKSTDVWLGRWFKDERSSPEELRQELIAYAVAHGWAQDDASTTAQFWSGSRVDPDTKTVLRLIIAAETDYSPTDVRYGTVYVSLSCR